MVIGIWSDQSRAWVANRLQESVSRAAESNGLAQLHFETAGSAQSKLPVDSL